MIAKVKWNHIILKLKVYNIDVINFVFEQSFSHSFI